MNNTKKSKSRLIADLDAAHRKAAIEAALDRIRQVALAMQTTDDIGSVVVETSDALIDLGIRTHRTTISIIDEKADVFANWASLHDGRSRKRQAFAPVEVSLSSLRKADQVFARPRPRGKRWMLHKYTPRKFGSEVRKYLKAMREVPEAGWLERIIRETPSPFYIYVLYFSGGVIGIGMDRELDRSEIAIARRVTETFDFAYKRFLDLQKLEQRAREAEVEAALERVRSEALAMQTSADMPSVAAAVLREFTALKLPTLVASIGITDPARNLIESWAALPEGIVDDIDAWQIVYRKDVTVAIEHFDLKKMQRVHPFLRKYLIASPDGKAAFHVQPVTRQDVKNIARKQAEYGLITRKQRDAALRGIPDGVSMGIVQHAHGYIYSWLTEQPSDFEIDVIKRFAETFAHAYDRFLELQDKERRAREAEVEAALERVRSQALAMQTPDDLPAVSATMFRELQSLYPSATNSVIGVPDFEADLTKQWVVLPEGFSEDYAPDVVDFDGTRVGLERFILSKLMRVHPELEAAIRGSESDEKPVYVAKPLDFEHAAKTMLEEGLWTPKEARQVARWDRGALTLCFAMYRRCYLFMNVPEALNDEEVEEFKRFAETFSFAYDRFLELQAKEQRAREAEVEAALERIRSQALAMETSADIPAVSAALFRELKALDYRAVTSIIGIPDVDRNLTTQWVAVPDSFDVDPDAWQIVYDDDVIVAIEHFDLRNIRRVHPFYRKHVRVAEDGQTSFHTQLFTKRDFAGIVKRQVELGLHSKKQSGDLGSIDTDMYASFVRHAHGYLLFFLLEPLTESEVSELKRLAETFSFAYDRFLDLQDKEQRAREAEIEAALERMRSQALAMQKSEDLPSVSAALFRELGGLAFPILSSSIAVLHEDRNWVDQWTTVVRGLEDLAAECGPVYKLDPVVLLEQATLSDLYYAIPQWKRAHAAWKRTGVTVQKIRFPGRELEKVFERIVEIGFWTEAYKEAQLEHEVGDIDLFEQWLVYYKHGHLCLDLDASLSEFEIATIGRFADAFGFAYDRFLDLQDKERRAREAEVEAALERVRSQALAMQTSDDLPAASAAMYRELSALFPDTYTSVIGTFDERKEIQTQWVVVAEDQSSDAYIGTKDYDGIRVAKEQFETKVILQAFPFIRDWVDSVPNETAACHTGMVTTAQMHRGIDRFVKTGQWTAKQGREQRKWWPGDSHNVCVNHGYAYVFSWHANPLSEAEVEEYKRFAEVWSFAYERFLDLQSKERRALEAEVEAALERVRAQALAMQATEDLSSVSAALFRELNALAFPVLNSGICVIDEAQDLVQQWTVLPQGLEHLADQLGRVYDAQDPPVILERFARSKLHRAIGRWGTCYRTWKKTGEVAHALRWTRRQMDVAHDRMVALDIWTEEIAEPHRQFLDENAVFDQSLLFYKHGYLFLNQSGPLDAFQLDAMKRFADAFGFAYDRFLDLQDKERRARGAEVEAALERVRSQALAMETSRDIPAVAAAVFRELAALDYGMMHSLIGIPNSEKDLTTQWVVLTEEIEGWDIVYRGDVLVAIEQFELSALVKAHAANERLNASWSGEPVFLPYQFKRQELLDTFERYVELGQWSREKADAVSEIEIPETSEFSVVQYKHGYMAFWLPEPFDEPEVEELKRFADTFSFAYDRFLDLQDKERRAREAEVEAALERVRSQALAMQTSEDLPAASAAMFRELSPLYPNAYTSVIGTLDTPRQVLVQWTVVAEDQSSESYIGTKDYDGIRVAPEQFDLPVILEAHPFTQDVFPSAPHRTTQYHTLLYTREDHSRAVDRIVESGNWTAKQGREHRAWWPGECHWPFAMHGNAYTFTLMSEPLAESEVDEFKRFAEVWSFAYDRFLDLQDKEQRAREAEVEAALERVRSQALSMQTTEDLPSVSSALFRELDALAFPVMNSGICVVDKTEDLALQWTVLPKGLKRFAPQLGRLYEEQNPPIILERYERRKLHRAISRWGKAYDTWKQTGEVAHSLRWTRRQLDAGHRRMVSLGIWTEEIAEAHRRYLGEGDVFDQSLVFYKHGYLFLNQSGPLDSFQLDALKRFADAFGFAYDRFLDLQGKEQRVREAEIEAALERVRARALGMQESSEVNDVVWDLLEEARRLEFPLHAAVIVLLDRTQGWAAIRFLDRGEGAHQFVPNPDPLSDMERKDRAARKRGEDWLVYGLPPALVRTRKRKMRSGLKELGIRQKEIERRLADYPKEEVIHIGLIEYGSVRYTADRQMSEEELAVLKRFTDVFTFAYRRFLELESKEAQNRELTIQNAIERVRAKAQGMQESEEIAGVAEAVYEEFNGLGYALNRAVVHLADDQSGYTRAYGFGDALDKSIEGLMVGRLHATEPGAARRRREARKHGEWYAIRELASAELRRTRRTNGKRAGLEREELAVFVNREPKSEVRHHVLHANGSINFVRETRMTEDDLVVAKRFTDVFDYAYDRFRELREKEDQNRELTIQNAIERVRSRALGMQESGELPKVSEALFEALTDVGIESLTSWVSTVDEERGVGTMAFVTLGEPMHTTTVDVEAGKEFDPTLWTAFREGKPYLIREHSLEASRALLEGYADIIKQTNPDYDAPAEGLESEEPWVDVNAFGKHTSVGFGRRHPITEEEAQVVKRFGDVFAFAYGRFLELRQKEEQNRELTIQNALERVRARALGMQESGEILDVAKLNFEEMKGLGYDLWSSDIFFFSVEGDYLHYYGTQDPDAKDGPRNTDTVQGSIALEPISESQDRHRFIQLAWDKLKNGERQLSYRMEGDELAAYLSDTIEFVYSETDRDAILARIPEVISYNRFFIEDPSGPADAMGAVDFTVRGEPLDEEGMAVGRRFADAFEFAYSRFRELKQKEDQNHELTIQNALERVRARALGMQESDEIFDVATMLFEEFEGLGIGVRTLGLWIDDAEADTREIWGMRPGIGLLTRLRYTKSRFDRLDIPFVRGLLASAARKDPTFSHVWGDEAEYQTFWRHLIEDLGVAPEEIGSGPDHNGPPFDAGVTIHQIFHAFGGLELWVSEPLPDDEIHTAGRFANAFEFAYGRYLELEQKEARAREAEQQAAVDRMRAEATAMESTEDIANVVKTLWEGLVAQGLDFTTLNFRVEDREADELQMYLATHTDSEGLTYPEERLLTRDMLDGVNLYRSTMPLAETKGERLRGSYGGLSEGVSHDFRTLWGFDLPADFQEAVQRVIVPFDFGQISVVRGGEPFVEADIEMVEPFAEGVSLGFTRYFDFQALEAKNVDLEEANEQIQEATRLKSQFLATMSHELRTPMNAIIGFTRLVTRRRAENLTDRQRENLDKVQLSADHLLNLINEILDLSKVEAGRVEIEPSTFKVAPLVQGACDTVGPTLGKTGVEVICDVEDDVGEAFTDDARLRQIVINLLSNALKFTDQGEVRVGVRREQAGGRRGDGSSTASDVVIAVSDTGIGIPEEELGNIFEEFRQVDGTSTRRHQGTGLGLAITKKLVELLGGEIGVASEVGVGSTFTFRIPSRFGETLAGGTGGETLSPSTVHRPPSTVYWRNSRPPTADRRQFSRFPDPGSRFPHHRLHRRRPQRSRPVTPRIGRRWLSSNFSPQCRRRRRACQEASPICRHRRHPDARQGWLGNDQNAQGRSRDARYPHHRPVRDRQSGIGFLDGREGLSRQTDRARGAVRCPRSCGRLSARRPGR